MGTSRSKGTVLALVVSAGAGHVHYPAWLLLSGRGTRPDPPAEPAVWPPVTVVVPAYREACGIEAKVRDVLANGYPGDIEVLVVADGDAETAAAAARSGARVVAPPDRLGKAQAVNLGIASARHPLAVLTDANNRMAPGSVAALVAWLGDPRVGAVAGDKVVDDAGGGQSMYWRFESWLKRREAAMGTTIGLVGELAAVRVDAWEPIPDGIGSDDLWIALDMAQRGHAVAYEPRAVAHEQPSPSLGIEWERRTRIVAGAFAVFRRRPHQLFDSGMVSIQIWGHRLWRYTAGPLSHLALVLVAASSARRSLIARAVFAGHSGAALALLSRARGHRLPPPVAVASEVVFLQAVAIGGMARFAAGYRGVVWHRPPR